MLLKKSVQIFVEFPLVGLVDHCAAQRALILGLHPLLDARGVKAVLHVAREGRDLLVRLELIQTDRALFLVLEQVRVERALGKTLNHCFGDFLAGAL